MEQVSDSSRCAVIVLRDRRVYEGPTELIDGWVHCQARRRVRHGDEVTYRPASERSWPRREVREIRWLDRADA